MSAVRQKSYSRPIGVAEHLLEGAIDSAAVLQRHVLLIGDEFTLSTNNGRNCLVDAFMLLSRFVGRLTVVIPTRLDGIYSQIEQLRVRSYFSASVTILQESQSPPFEIFDAILNIGSNVHSELPWTSINSNGWLARVSSGSTELPSNCGQDNAIGALMAASLGATEVFKRIFSIPCDVAPMMDFYELSLFEMTTAPSGPGPVLPAEMIFPDSILVGGGAIGNGIALLFSQLPIVGRLHIIDKQDYAEENFGTCVLMEADGWLGISKAERLAMWLNQDSALRTSGTRDFIDKTIDSGALDDLNIGLVLTALDDVDARRESQRLWPPIIVDGGINEIGAAVIQHRLNHPSSACLQCWFEKPKVDERIEQSQWTGLQIDRLGDLDRTLTEDDISNAAAEKQGWLRQCKSSGKKLCSIITEAQLQSRLGIEVEDGFRPSVPFVATAAAALVLSETIKACKFPDAPFGSLFQLANLFIGPDALIVANRQPSPSCACVTHRDIIKRLHARRSRNFA
jgi:hypothetical protein